MAKLLEGKIVADEIKESLRLRIQSLKQPPVIASILVGDNPSAVAYVEAQAKVAQSLGVIYKLHRLAESISEDELIDFVLKLNADVSVNGIIVQIPLPQHISYMRICEFIQPHKDIEGMHPTNIGKLLFGRARIVACTANAVMELLNSTGIDLDGKEVVVVGHSVAGIYIPARVKHQFIAHRAIVNIKIIIRRRPTDIAIQWFYHDLFIIHQNISVNSQQLAIISDEIQCLLF